jgi:hypothetical protein
METHDSPELFINPPGLFSREWEKGQGPAIPRGRLWNELTQLLGVAQLFHGIAL